MKLKFLLFLFLIFSFSAFVCGQENNNEESSIISVPETTMREVVRRILIYNFKPGNQNREILLSEKLIEQDWLPEIKNIEFHLLTETEIEDSGKEVYFFTQPEKSNETYEIGFAYGDPGCSYLGRNSWKFRIAKNKVRLWQTNGGFGGGCGESGSWKEFDKPGNLNEFPNELEGYKFFDLGKLKGLKLAVSTKKNVKDNLGEDCEYSCDFSDKWKISFRYFGDFHREQTFDGKKTKYIAKPELVDKLYRITLIPKSTLLFDKVIFPPPFRKSNGFTAAHDGNGGGTNSSYYEYKDRYGLEYTILDEISLTTIKDLKWEKGELRSINYTIPEKLEKTMFIEQQ